MQTSSKIEGFSIANVLQVKLQIFVRFKLAPDGFLVDEYGSLYKHVIKIAFVEDSKEFLPVIDKTN